MIRVNGSITGQRFTPPTGAVSVNADLAPGVFTVNSLDYDMPGSNVVFTGSQSFVDPITFVSTTYDLNVTVGSFSASFSAGPAALTASTGGLDFDASGTLGGSLTMAGSYSIVGPSSTVMETFSLNLPITPTTRLRGTLSNIDFPNSFDLDLDPVGFRFGAFGASSAVIFNEVVDGNALSAELSLVDFLSSGSVPLTAIPEPSAVLLAGLGALAALGRRRRA
ncbi:MAG: PEP-CTERM sorting domain-containing protein [Akkermansiaceae bacterium]|nr:PEP-CTERM sorting domain-containing protein [Akkermansiaceae bacterium]